MVDRTKEPECSAIDNLRFEMPPSHILDNGIQCWVIDGGDDEICKVNLYFKVGMFMENKNLQALFAASMLVEGTGKLSSQEIADKFDYYGAKSSVSVLQEYTEISLLTLNRYFKDTFGLLLHCIQYATFNDKELEVLKRRLISRVNILNERVDYLANEEMKLLYYGEEHPLSRHTDEKAIKAIDRSDLISLHKEYYIPQNCQVVIAGKVTAQILEQINESLGQWHVDPIKGCVNKPIMASPSAKMFSVIDKQNSIQSAILVRVKTISRTHEDYLPLRFLVMVLGGYFGSRLMTNIREDKGYTYGISAALYSYCDDGYIEIQCQCATQYTMDVIKEIKNEFSRLCTELIPDEETTTVRMHILTTLAKTFDTPFSMSSYFDSIVMSGVYPEYFNEQVECVRTITSRKLLEIAQKYLNLSEMRIVVAGDESKILN